MNLTFAVLSGTNATYFVLNENCVLNILGFLTVVTVKM